MRKRRVGTKLRRHNRTGFRVVRHSAYHPGMLWDCMEQPNARSFKYDFQLCIHFKDFARVEQHPRAADVDRFALAPVLLPHQAIAEEKAQFVACGARRAAVADVTLICFVLWISVVYGHHLITLLGGGLGEWPTFSVL